jgi:hypothetical protein
MPGVFSVFIVAESVEHMTTAKKLLGKRRNTSLCLPLCLAGCETVRRLMPGVISVFIVAESVVHMTSANRP